MKIRFRRLISVSGALFLVIVSFQNCSRNNIRGSGSRDTRSNLSGGQAYDGKLYVLDGNCADGSKVDSRIVLEMPKMAYLVRNGCSTITPRQLDASEYSYDESDPSHLKFGAVVFHAETPSISIAPLSKAYYQWNGAFLNFSSPITYFVDGMEVTNSEIASLKSVGHTVICLITAGATVRTDADFGQFNASDMGRAFGSQFWLDTRSPNVRAVLMNRLLRAVSIGCQGVLWDQTDSYLNNSGFPLTEDSAVDFLKYLSMRTRDYGLLVALANTPGLASQVVDYFDLAYSQNCNQAGYCSSFVPFVDKHKPVLVSDDRVYSASLCQSNAALGFTLWFTSPTQDGSRYESCP